ncbi:unnamed protein product [Bursaphelenchus okinawaensis]|uniref:Uncharacterized protein n=1 Tax=Bursaphelenchus okinawaensis TaxID=465554 RepID=A0A811K5K7_9BILA|nr:unnamed protein product [Bursaphelenchus okinawaensis]CAG9093042.1 unnamed protein product [Bursaphelenchus okinawaensis]
MWFWNSTVNQDHDKRIEDAIRRLEETRIEREIALKEAINERKNAFRIAEAQERFQWVALTGIATTFMSIASSFHHKNLFYVLPAIPCTIIVGYEAHKAYGNKINIITTITDAVMKDVNKRLTSSVISVKEIDARVQDLLYSPEAID